MVIRELVVESVKKFQIVMTKKKEAFKHHQKTIQVRVYYLFEESRQHLRL